LGGPKKRSEHRASRPAMGEHDYVLLHGGTVTRRDVGCGIPFVGQLATYGSLRCCDYAKKCCDFVTTCGGIFRSRKTLVSKWEDRPLAWRTQKGNTDRL